MFDRELNVGDYIFQANGNLAKITGKTKTYYTYRFINRKENAWYYTGKISINGSTKHTYSPIEEWFYCDEPTAKALEFAFQNYKIKKEQIDKAEKINVLLGKAKCFLEQIKDIKTIDVEEE